VICGRCNDCELKEIQLFTSTEKHCDACDGGTKTMVLPEAALVRQQYVTIVNRVGDKIEVPVQQQCATIVSCVGDKIEVEVTVQLPQTIDFFPFQFEIYRGPKVEEKSDIHWGGICDMP